MALSLILGEAQLTAEQMETTAEVTLEKDGDGYAITKVHLTLRGEGSRRRAGAVPGARQQGEAGLPGVKALEGRDHARRRAWPDFGAEARGAASVACALTALSDRMGHSGDE